MEDAMNRNQSENFTAYLPATICTKQSMRNWNHSPWPIQHPAEHQIRKTPCGGMGVEHTFKSLPEYPSVAEANSSSWKSGAKSSSAKITFIILARLSASGKSTINLHVTTKSHQTKSDNTQHARANANSQTPYRYSQIGRS